MAKKAKKKLEKRWWTVPVRETLVGYAEVEAETAEEAMALVNAGDYDINPGCERVNWEARGKARDPR